MLLTIYNILPTLLFYSQPLKKPIGKEQGEAVASAIAMRVNHLEEEAFSYLASFNKLLGIKATSMSIDPNNPQLIYLEYGKREEAEKFRKYLPRAGALIPFVPAQLALLPTKEGVQEKQVVVERNISVHIAPEEHNSLFVFTEKVNEEGGLSFFYRMLIHDRMLELALATGGASENSTYLNAILEGRAGGRTDEFMQILSENIITYAKVFGESSPLARRYYATFTQSSIEDKGLAIEQFAIELERYRDRVRLERIALEKRAGEVKEEGGFLESDEQQKLELLKGREQRLARTLGIVQKESDAFSSGTAPWNVLQLKTLLTLLAQDKGSEHLVEVGERNPLIEKLTIDWRGEVISVELHKDLLAYKESLKRKGSPLSDHLDQLIYHEVARLSRKTGETIKPHLDAFEIQLNQLEGSQSLLALNLENLAQAKERQLFHLIQNHWHPSHPDLVSGAFPLYDDATFRKLPLQQQKIGLVIYSPTQTTMGPPVGLKTGSVYVIAKGVEQILKKLQENPNHPQNKRFLEDFGALQTLLQSNGFTSFSGATYPIDSAFAGDFIFENSDFYQEILKATRENFQVRGTKKFATLEFTDLEQRILALNRIETEQHEDLLKWRDEYRASQVKEELQAKYDVPPPTASPLWSNLKLSARKYFRGDERKILRWGLDLSGGKTVQIELRDRHGRVVTSDADIRQGIDELYGRVNKMGVSEVAIRQEGSNITLDFPSAQNISASSLVKASSMYFHIVNEKFSPYNKALSTAVNQFLQEIWNEAVITNQTEGEKINEIAWKHLYGEISEGELGEPMTEAAKVLYEQGLRLSNPYDDETPSSQFNDVLSKIALYRGESFSEWKGQSHPLLIVMKNYALEGANLTDVHSSYDPSRGNYLAFRVKSSQTLSDGQKLNPRDQFYNWTAPFSKEKIQGSPFGQYSGDEGWRMATILNGFVINAATISSPLRDSVSITGNFTQREASHLEADLKAGSLTFAPYILSEKNVSPELGLKDRTMGIIATIVALLLVIAVMVGYYRFAGVIASIAVVINLLIIWATLQNISATVTLAGIAGAILTVGMAVDANVLVFERIREEFALSKRLGLAVHAGYRKAFSAILDSNVTTIIAALILLQFDSGPIKGLALTLIIGIASSMFTALFMTRYFFAKWVENPKNKTLKMANFIKASRFNFLKYGKLSLYSAVGVALVGLYLLSVQKESIFGMDFTGGYRTQFEVSGTRGEEVQERVESALIAAGLSKQDFQVRSLSSANQVKLLLGRGMDKKGKPFYNMPLEIDAPGSAYSYQSNPRLVWVVEALRGEGIELTSSSLTHLDQNWTSISGQMSSAMRSSALWGLSIALLAILAYITIRFEFKYAISATLGLAIDLGVALAAIALFHALGAPVQIDLNTIAALMTIIGYSLNDTIIIFDRIREDLKSMKKASFTEVINHALNVTLSRTVMTSTTTLVVLLALITLGGSAIFGLSFVMVVGVVFGTFSSLFIAAPLLLFFHNQEHAKKEKMLPERKLR